MNPVEEMDALSILKKAYKKETIEVKIDFGNNLKAIITLADAIDMFTEQRKLYREKLGYYEGLGYTQKPIDEIKWNEYVKINPADNKRPENLAEQLAGEDTRNIILREILPKFLKKESGDLLFESDKQQRAAGNYIISTPALANLISDKLLELTEKSQQVMAQTKNFLKQES